MSVTNRDAVPAAAPDPIAAERPVGIPHHGEFLTGSLGAVRAPRAVVLIANDRGCARHDPALCALAAELRREGFATLMVDLVRPGEPCSEREMDSIAARLHSARDWLGASKLAESPVVLLGMGAAAPLALLAAATGPAELAAAIACGPRPDAAGVALGLVSCPSLLIAHTGPFGDLAAHVRALGRLGGRHDLAVLDEGGDSPAGARLIARATARFLKLNGPKHQKVA